MVVANIVYQLSDWRDNKIFDSDKNGGCLFRASVPVLRTVVHFTKYEAYRFTFLRFGAAAWPNKYFGQRQTV